MFLRRGWGSQACLASRRLKRILSVCTNGWWESVKKIEALLSGAQWQNQRQWAEMETQEVLSEHQETPWGWRSSGAGCPERWWSLPLCRYSTKLYMALSNLVQVTLPGAAGAGLANLQRSLAAQPCCYMYIWCMCWEQYGANGWLDWP